jgi:uncharacterized protein YbjQ (UPF0145 family)
LRTRSSAAGPGPVGAQGFPARLPAFGRIPAQDGGMTNIEDFGGAAPTDSGVLVVTTNDVPGFRVDQVIGEVFGLTVRSRHLGTQVGASFKSMVGGELKGLTKTLVESRNQAMQRLVEQVRARGGNAVLAMRFDVTEAAGLGTEICAYGTAVVISPLS